MDLIPKTGLHGAQAIKNMPLHRGARHNEHMVLIRITSNAGRLLWHGPVQPKRKQTREVHTPNCARNTGGTQGSHIEAAVRGWQRASNTLGEQGGMKQSKRPTQLTCSYLRRGHTSTHSYRARPVAPANEWRINHEALCHARMVMYLFSRHETE